MILSKDSLDNRWYQLYDQCSAVNPCPAKAAEYLGYAATSLFQAEECRKEDRNNYLSTAQQYLYRVKRILDRATDLHLPESQ